MSDRGPASASDDVIVRRYDSVDDIADGWRHIVGRRSFHLDPLWVRASEPDAVADRDYGVVDGPTGPLAAIAVRRLDGDTFPTYDPVAALTTMPDGLMGGSSVPTADVLKVAQASLAKHLNRLRPAAVALLPGSYVSGVVRRVDDRPVIDALIDHLEEVADGWGSPLRSVMHVPEEDDVLVQALTARGYLGCVVTAQCEIPVPDGGFDDYLASLTSDRRRKVRKEMDSFASSGLVLRRLGPEALQNDALAWRMASLQSEQLGTYGHDVPPQRLRQILASSAETFGSWISVLLAERGGEVEAFVLSYADDTTLYPKMAGWTDEARRDAAYFTLGYYEQIRQAGEHGLRSVIMGPESFYPKVRRGARLLPRMMFVRVAGAEMPGLGDVVEGLDAVHRHRLTNIE